MSILSCVSPEQPLQSEGRLDAAPAPPLPASLFARAPAPPLPASLFARAPAPPAAGAAACVPPAGAAPVPPASLLCSPGAAASGMAAIGCGVEILGLALPPWSAPGAAEPFWHAAAANHKTITSAARTRFGSKCFIYHPVKRPCDAIARLTRARQPERTFMTFMTISERDA